MSARTTKITPEVAWSILDQLAEGIRPSEIAKQLGVHPSTIGDVRDGIRRPDVHQRWHAKHSKQAG